MGCATWRPSQRISVTYRNTKINMYLVVEVSPCMALLPLRTSCWPDVAKSTINLETIQVGMENPQWRRTNQLLMYQKKHVGKATCFASEDPISQQVARFRCPYEYPQKFSICWLVSIYLVAPSFSTAMFSWLLHCKKKGMFVGWYRHIYIICFSLTPLTNANGFRFGNSMNGTKKSAKVDTVYVCVIGFTTLSKKEME